jgi:predicted NBD/HSP70 family sugar kinase
MLAINIGGTTTKWAIVESHTLTDFTITETSSARNFAAFRDLLLHIAGRTPAHLNRVAIGFPGPISSTGKLSTACTLMPGQNLLDLNLCDEVNAVWPGAHVNIINDVSAYGHFLLQEGYTDFCVINIGSGIGSKVYMHGIEMLGPNGRGGEIGHWSDLSVPSDLKCDCGGNRHVGAISSGRGVLQYARLRAALDPVRYIKSHMSLLAPQHDILNEFQFVDAVYAEDPFALEILSDAMIPLARAAALIHLAVGCERFFLVGGFAAALDGLLEQEMANLSAKMSWSNGFDWLSAYHVLKQEVRASLQGLYHYGSDNGQVHCAKV